MVDDNRARLIAAVATRLQIRIDEDDPGFVIVELNRLMLDQAIRELLQAFRAMEAKLSNVPDQAPPSTTEFTEAVSKSVSASVIAYLRETKSNHPGVTVQSKSGATWRMRVSGIAITTALAGALILSAFAVGYSLHFLPV